MFDVPLHRRLKRALQQTQKLKPINNLNTREGDAGKKFAE